MARAVTDRVTFAWVGDILVLEELRGRALGRSVVEAPLERRPAGRAPDHAGDGDAHALHRSYGLSDSTDPER